MAALVKTKVVVVANHGSTSGVERIVRVAARAGWTVHLVQNGDGDGAAGSETDGRWRVLRRANVGREFGAYLEYVVRHYDALPQMLAFCPSTVNKRNRLVRLRWVLHGESELFSGAHPLLPWLGLLPPRLDFKPGEHLGEKLRDEDDLDLHEWCSRYDVDALPIQLCYNGVFRTAATFIRRRPKSFYADLLNSLSASGPTPRVGHYAERFAESIFAPDCTLWDRRGDLCMVSTATLVLLVIVVLVLVRM
jgi:hypothetical protein